MIIRFLLLNFDFRIENWIFRILSFLEETALVSLLPIQEGGMGELLRRGRIKEKVLNLTRRLRFVLGVLGHRRRIAGFFRLARLAGGRWLHFEL